MVSNQVLNLHLVWAKLHVLLSPLDTLQWKRKAKTPAAFVL